MAQTLISFRIDKLSKKQMEHVCGELGLTMEEAFTIFAKKVVREKRIPFDLSIDPFYSESNRKALEESKKELENGNIVLKSMKELEILDNK